MKGLNIRNFPDELYREVRIEAAKEGKTLKDWIIEAIKEKLARNQK